MPNVRQTAQVPFGGQASGLEELGGAAPLCVNLLRDATGWIRMVPGSSAWDWFPSAIPDANAIDGITDFQGKVVYVTRDRRLWVVEAPGLVTALSPTATEYLDGGLRPVFARTRTALFISGGGALHYWTGMGDSARVTWAIDVYSRTAPPTSTHVVAIAQRLVVNSFDGSGQVAWTDAEETAHLTSAGWDPLNFAEAESQPDPLIAVHDNSAMVFAFGTRTLQAFVPDANVGFSPISAVNIGCQAAYSIIPLQDKRVFAWLTPDREFVLSNGQAGGEQYLSHPLIAQNLSDMARVSDCFGYRQKVEDHDLLTWTFPTTGATFVYDLTSQCWSEQRGRSATGEWSLWPVTAYHFWADKNVHLLGLATGEIVVLDGTSPTMAGQVLKLEAVSGFQSRPVACQSNLVRLPMRRGTSTATTPPYVQLSYRDGTGAWSTPAQLSMGVGGDYKPYAQKRLVGRTYVRRQWRLEMSDSVSTTVGPLEEQYEVLGGEG